MKKLLLVAGFCALPLFLAAIPSTKQEKVTSQPVARTTQSTKELKVRQLLALTGGQSMGEQLMSMMIKQFERMPQLPVGYIAKFKELAKPNELVELIIPIYSKNVEERDLDAIIKFFQSDSGKRWTAAQPKIMLESRAVNEKWGRALAQKVMAELRK